MTEKRTTSDAVRILEQLTGHDAELRGLIARETQHCRIARMVYDARTTANLTQKQLAEAVETSESVIAAIEDADCDDVDSWLGPIGDALHVEFDFEGEVERAT